MTSRRARIKVKDHVSAVRDRINACYKIHKLFRRSEQTRKVAEARREFYQKFGTKIPDKKRLTMMDLIYYNPTSNPMPKKESKTNNELEIIETIPDENPEEENEDEPDETNAGEDATPVPQVKVGPNGEIILDEQSLVIEQTGTKKGREKLANSQIVNVDDLDRTYGIYKRPKRAKDWNVVETLRFYKTLNTVGTDFSLMLSLFPGRTRRELKIKFKKEEKLNRALIDKALMNPVEFDFTELEQQLVADEVALAADKEEKEKRKQKVMRQKKRKSASALAADMEEEENVDDDLEEQNVAKKPRKGKDKYSVLEDGLYELLTPMSDNEESLTNTTEVRKSRPSRACRRISKYTDGEDSEAEEEDEDTNNNETSLETTEKNDSIELTIDQQNINITEENEPSMIEENEIIDDENMMKDSERTEKENTNEQNETMEESIIEENGTEKNEENSVVEPNKNTDLVPVTDEQNCAVPNILPNDLSTVEPGSLMILSSLAADGQQVFKVFMVTPGQTKVPVNLSPDVVESLTTSLGTAETITLDLPVINDGDKSVIPESDSAVTT
ncbi:B double prime 1 [Carabus blaptoides fortunei]